MLRGIVAINQRLGNRALKAADAFYRPGVSLSPVACAHRAGRRPSSPTFPPRILWLFDWHSAVHSHWCLIKLIRSHQLPNEAQIRNKLQKHLTRENLKREAEYFEQPNRKSFERMYGWAGLLKLVEELHTWPDHQAPEWRPAIRPLEEVVVALAKDYLPRQTYPIRVGTHTNTAFALTLMLEYAEEVLDRDFAMLIRQRARDYFLSDLEYPVHLEPSGADFLSPALMEAALMSRVLEAAEFEDWLIRFLPNPPRAILAPPVVSDRSDPQICHLDGLSLSRAWCMRVVQGMDASAEEHLQATLPHLSNGEYVGEHWLASFAVLALTAKKTS